MPEKKLDSVSCSARATASEPTPSAVSAGASEMPSASEARSAVAERQMTQMMALPMPEDDFRPGLDRP